MHVRTLLACTPLSHIPPISFMHSSPILYGILPFVFLTPLYFLAPFIFLHTVVFGKVVEGMAVVKKVESCGTKSGKTTQRVVIAECGEVGRV